LKVQDSSPVSFTHLQETLAAANAESGASEAHGLVAGIVCAGGNTTAEPWLQHVLGEGHPGAAASAAREQLAVLCEDVLRQLHDDSFGFDLLLPSDEAPLSQRTEALSQWSGGFLYGLALGGIREGAELPESVAEAMKDFYEISHARFAYEQTDDADEAAYMEIVEYVRMSVLLLHEELRPMPAHHRLQ
jgi:yecA family protein